MKREVLCGIYAIQNKINKKTYIGQSIDIYDRWSEHISELRNKKHRNKHLQRSWDKYGEDNFQFNIIDICSDDKLNDLEIFYIDKFDSFENGYNQTLGGGGSLGRLHSEETKKKISKANKGRLCSNVDQLKKINHTNKKPILQLDIEGNIIKRWECELEIRKELGIDTRSIRGCCKFEPKRITYKNYIWTYEDHYHSEDFDINYYLKRKIIKEVIQYTKEGVFVKEWSCIKDASDELKIKDSHISLCCKGKMKTAGGYKWEYKYIQN